mmetsp:Transcript_6399/g.19081  ORF Transcript_6399/g.19081 Transcript_6399/m.19081 type:complete len:213 (+) Transcript_6399:92-730(+)
MPAFLNYTLLSMCLPLLSISLPSRHAFRDDFFFWSPFSLFLSSLERFLLFFSFLSSSEKDLSVSFSWAGFAFIPLVTFLFAPPLPNSTALTCAANFNEHDVSSPESSSGLTLTNIKVFPSPPKHGANKYVNFELRYGTCFALLPSAAKTSPNDDKLLLIAHASFKRSPLAPDLATRSLPAKSTRFKAPDNVEPLAECSPETCKMKIVCERDE